MTGVETIVSAVIFTVIGMIASHIAWMKVYGKELKAIGKKMPKLMKTDMKSSMMKTVVMTFIMGVFVSVVYGWAQPGIAAFGTLGGALLGAALWIAFPFAMTMIDAAWFNRERAIMHAALLHMLLTLVVGGYAIAWYMGL